MSSALTISAFMLALAQIGASDVHLDGEFVHPIHQSTSYVYTCRDGVVTIEIAQEHPADPTPEHPGDPTLRRLEYHGRSLRELAEVRIDNALRQLRAVESITPRCLSSGGINMLLDGLARDNPPRMQTVAITIDSRGAVSVH